MKRLFLPVTVALVAGTGCQSPFGARTIYHPSDYAAQTFEALPGDPEPVRLTEEALRIHHSAILVDGHNDLPGIVRTRGDSSFDKIDISDPQPQIHTDIERLLKGGLGAQFWSAYVPSNRMEKGDAMRYGLEQIDLVHRMVERYPTVFEMAYTADDIVRIRRAGRIASMIGVEGGHAIQSSLGALRMFYALGVRYITLTHSKTHDWADSCTDEARHGGLTDFGEQIVLEMNRLGMFVDISHVSPDTMRDVLRIAKAPVIASHSSSWTLRNHPRNVPKDVLELVARNGGVIMVNFASGFVTAPSEEWNRRADEKRRELEEQNTDEGETRRAFRQWRRENPTSRGTVHTVVDHIEQIIKEAGIDHVGIGSDYDGISTLPTQLEDVSCYPFITQELLNRGYGERDIHKILGQNLIRAFREAERVAREWE